MIPFILTGFFATAVMTVTIFSVRIVSNVQMSIPLMLGNMILPHASDVWKRRVGMAMHLAVGSFGGGVFGFLSQNTTFFDETVGLSGVLFALILWALMMTLTFPMGGYGFFGVAKDKRIWIVALAGHVVYGISLVFLLPLIK